MGGSRIGYSLAGDHPGGGAALVRAESGEEGREVAAQHGGVPGKSLVVCEFAGSTDLVLI